MSYNSVLRNNSKSISTFLSKYLAWIYVVGGALGLAAAFVLTLEKIELLKDPAHQLSCSLNPVLSCGSIIGSDQASAFGFPNPFIGIAGFSVVITIGMAIFAGAKFKKWFWQGLQIGSLLGVIFVHWLIHESLYEIGALCLYCMLVWSVTMPIFWYTTLRNINEGDLIMVKSESLKKFIFDHHLDILVSWYVIVIVLILVRFWYYWSTVI